jgi:hypothetical protein
MNPHRPRRPRTDGAALRYLDLWRRHVVRTERDARTLASGPATCRDYPCCEKLWHDDAHRRLESLMRKRGRRAHRLRVAVQRLDERFRAATVEAETWRSAPWWARREVDWER